MANPAVIKAAAALLSDERARKGIGWIIAAILSPLIVLLALLCALSAGSDHNVSVIELCFNGGALPPDTPAEYVAYIEDMRSSFAQLDSCITAMAVARIADGSRITDVFDINFDRQELSTVRSVSGWMTYRLKDVSTAVWHADRGGSHDWNARQTRLTERLTGKEITSAGHLSAENISLAEDICEMDGQRLNFYLDTGFNVDAVFGTHVCTAENDDTLNVYADYDMRTGQVCDMLEVDLHWADGREESVEYRLDAVEKAVLLWKMDDYCQQQTGQTLEQYSAQLMAEDMTPPAGPAMEANL